MPNSVFGQTDTTFLRLDQVTVLGLRKQQKFFSTQILKDSTLFQMQNLSVADALRFFSGVQIKDYGGIGGLKTVNIQNLGTQHTGVFYDGIAINDMQNGTVDLGKFSLENLESVAVSFGQNGQLLKSAKAYSMANVIELETKKAVFKEEKLQNWNIKLQGGSFGMWGISTLWQQKIGQHWANSFQIEHMQSKGNYPFMVPLNNSRDSTLRRTNAGIKSLRIENILRGDWKNHDWKVQSYYYQSGRGLPGAVVENKLTTEGQNLNDGIFFTQFSVKDLWKSKIHYQILGKYSHSNSRYIDRYWPSSSGILDQSFLQQESYFSAAVTYQITPFGSIALANDFSFQKLNADVFGFVFPKRWNQSTALATQWKWHDFEMQAHILRQGITDQTINIDTWKRNMKFTPSLALNWQPYFATGFQMNVFYKESFRMPNFNELYYTIIGNSDLEPEYAKQWGMDLILTRLRLQKHIFQVQIHTFLNTVDHKIIAVPNSNLFRWSMFNLLKTQSKGFSPQVNYTYQNQQWKIQSLFQYTLTQSKQMDESRSSYGQQIPYTPKHSGSLSVQAQWKQWSLNYAFIYTGERYQLPDAILQNYLQPWYTHDVGVQRKFFVHQIPVTTGVQINNVMNQAYEVVSNFPMPGIHFKLFLSTEI